jgi:acyl-coenzyme A thioesterase PaaI-like protein
MRRPLVFNNGTNRCFGCGPANPAGLRLSFVETDEGVEVEYTVPSALEGAPGVAHGGIQATLLDETLCMTAYAKWGTPVLTGELTVRYLLPVPTATPLLVRGRLMETKGKSAFIEGAIYRAGSDEELTRARGRFFANSAGSAK